jgi:hypothetical protein
MRNVICHYHIYKNSGSTFDVILSRNFGDRHVCFDGPFPYFSINQQELLKVILRNPAAVAFSSHQVALPVPTSLDVNVIPVVFVRHPLLRIHSIYRFKRAEKDGTETSRNAESMEFDAWCQHSLAHPQEVSHVSNAQTRMLAGAQGAPSPARRESVGMTYDYHQALRNLRTVDLLARTECFEADVGRFPELLAPLGIEFVVDDVTAVNVTASDLGTPIETRLEQLRGELQESTYEALCEANAQDVALYAEVCRRLG